MKVSDDHAVNLPFIRSFHKALFRTLVNFVLLLLGLFALYNFIPYISDALFMIVMATVLTAVISPAIDWMEARGMRRGFAVAIFFLVAFALVGFLISRGAPALIEEIGKLKDLIPADADNGTLDQLIGKFNTWVAQYFPDATIDSAMVAKVTSSFFAQIGSILSSTVSAFSSVVFILIITMFFLVDGRRMMKGLIGMVPNQYFEISLNISYKTQQQLTNFLRGQMIAASGVGIQSIIGLHILNWVFDANISGPFLIGGIAGFANIVPYIGPFAGMLPAVIVSLFNNFGDPVAASHLYFIPHIVVMFIIVQFIDNNFISPLVVSSSMAMHPLTVMLVILIGSKWGILGMLLAVPAWGIVKVIFYEVLTGIRQHRAAAVG
ncbi:MAG TPA: hypothetical protein DHU63_06360 [Candidatus Marinimicrobia bacterium]|nr:MAG: hypothetical protein AUJ47_01785 [Candidatus Marinimicrobia bacterium CG1_02_48_14]HCW76144.1 hypothetical protein [Candidatus Neomarinimicrobiota bacterium]